MEKIGGVSWTDAGDKRTFDDGVSQRMRFTQVGQEISFSEAWTRGFKLLFTPDLVLYYTQLATPICAQYPTIL